MTNSAEVLPPGEFLKDELEARNWSQTEFAGIIGRPLRLVNEIIAGKKSITPETAVQFGASLGTSAELWMNLESQYQLSKLRPTADVIQRKAKLHERFPVREITKRGWIGESDDIDILEHQLSKFYALASLDAAPRMAHAWKKTTPSADISIPQISWLFRVMHVAERMVTPKYKKSALLATLPKIRALLSAPEEIRHIPKLLNAVGVRFVVVEVLPGSKIDGACLWLKEQPVIAVSARLDRIDNFWFVLRHEIEHVIQEHGKDTAMVLDEDLSQSADSLQVDEERLANEAAAQFGVDDLELDGYMNRVNPYFFARDRVTGFAGRLGVHPGIVVGRLQKKLEQLGQEDSYKYLREYLVKVRHVLIRSAPADGWGNVYPIE